MKKRTMKACAMFLTLLFLMLVPVTAYADTAYVVTGTTNYLALRTEPRTDSRNEIGKLHNGDTFYVTSRSGGYAYGYTVLGIYGYVNANYLTAINYQPQPVAAGTAAACSAAAGRHAENRDRHQKLSGAPESSGPLRFQ